MLREAGASGFQPDRWMTKYVASPMGLAFMEFFPPYPVLRLRVEPGDMCITTENMLHDASTSGMGAVGHSGLGLWVFYQMQACYYTRYEMVMGLTEKPVCHFPLYNHEWLHQ